MFFLITRDLPKLSPIVSGLFNIIYSTLPKPDLLIYLYLNVDNLQRNIAKRGRSYEQEISNEYLLSIQESYFDYFKKQEHMKIVIVDTNSIDFVNRPEDYAKIEALTQRDYPVGITRELL